MRNVSHSEEKLRRISDEVQACTRCGLSKTRTKPVPGEGPPNARVMFIGEGPGRNEDAEGRPFVGRAGELLEKLLASAKLSRRSVYITNIVKCRPTMLGKPGAQPHRGGRDRRPTGEEIAACGPFLARQIAAIQPRIICMLGDTATRFIFKKYGLETGSISKVRGKVYEVGDLRLVPAYHPAAALYTPKLEAKLQRDFKKLAGIL